MSDCVFSHNGLLIDNLEEIQKQSPEKWEHTFRGFLECVEKIRKLEGDFKTCIQRLSELETRNPIPRSCALSMTDRQKTLSDLRNIDSVLRKIGAAQASMDLTLLHDNANSLLGSDTTTGGSNANGRTGRSEDRILIRHTEGLSTMFRSGDYQIRQLRNGDIYKGHYRGSKKHGEGVYQFVNGDVYEGEFVEDRLSGHGVYTFANEGRYEGEWHNSVYEGSGNETFARGSTYHGDYTCGMRNGWGCCRYYNGDYYEGQWKHGLREGRGMQQCTEESNYIGDYMAGKRHGYGYYCFPNSDRYLGEYEFDIPHGYGIYEFATGQKYEGQWKQGRKHGWCIYTIETGLTEEVGRWKCDLGEMWAGEWVEGKPKWVQSLSVDNRVSAQWPQEIVEKVEKAWTACKRARDVNSQF